MEVLFPTIFLVLLGIVAHSLVLALTLGLIPFQLVLNESDEELPLSHVVVLQVVLDPLEQILRHLHGDGSCVCHSVSFLHLIFRVELVIQCQTDELCHSHAVIPQVLTDLRVKVGVNPHGDPFLFAVRHCPGSFPNSF